MEINGYQLSRLWFDWCFENPEKISPNHTAIYFFAIEHCNRMGWKDKFGFPTRMAMDAIGIKKHQTYIRYFNDLVEWGFFKLIQKSINQYSSNIISLQIGKPKNGKALDKAIIRHGAKQIASTGQSTGQSNSPIDKPINQEPINQLTNKPFCESSFELFWDKYDKKVGLQKSRALWEKVPEPEHEKIMKHLDEYIKTERTYRKDPERYLKHRCWEDEVITKNNQGGFQQWGNVDHIIL